MLRWCCPPHRRGIFALVVLATLPGFCTGVNRPHCTSVFIVILLVLSPKAHIALVSLPLLHWRCHHRCVVCTRTNVGSRVIVYIGVRSPLHPFTALCDLVFNRSLDCNAMPKHLRACFHKVCSCNAIASLAAGNSSLVVAILLIILPDGFFSWKIPFDTVAPSCHVATLPYNKCNILFLSML